MTESAAPQGDSLRRQLTRRTFGIGLAGALFTATLVLVLGRQAVSEQVRGRLDDVAGSRASLLDSWVDERLRDVTLMSTEPELARRVTRLAQQPDPDAAREVAARLQALVPGSHFEELLVERGSDARVLAGTGPTPVGTYLDYPAHLVEGLRAPMVQEVYTSRVDGRPRITVAAPVRTGQDTAVAVLAGHLDLTYLEDVLAAEALLPGLSADVHLVSDAGDFVSATRFGRPGRPPGTSTEGIRLGLEGGAGVRAYEGLDGRPVLGAYRWMPERRMVLLVEVDAGAALWPARRLGLLALLAGLAGAAMVLWAARSMAMRVAAPLEALSANASRIDGGEFPVELHASPEAPLEVRRLGEAFGSMVRRLEAHHRDLEHQVDATARALREAESSRGLLQSIVDNSPSLIGVCSKDGTIQLANRPLRALLAPDGSVIVGRRFDAVLPGPLARTAPPLLAQAIREDRVVETEIEAEVEGVVRSYLVLLFPLHGVPGSGADAGFIGLDRTERLAAEARQLALEGQLRHAQKLESLGALAGGIAHDFNNLLQVVLGHLSLLRREVEPEAVEAHVQQIEEAATRAADLTAQLLTYAGKRTVRTERVDVNLAIRQLSELISVTLPKGAEYRQDLDDSAGSVSSDPAQVSQVVMNLVTNAAESLGQAGGHVHVRTRSVRLGQLRTPDRPSRDELPDGRYVEIVVEDGGSGMDEDMLGRIFEPFFTTRSAGRGLGLASVLGIVQGSGGHIRADSTPGEGSRFVVLLPSAKAVPTDARRRRPGDAALAGRQVLVADDEPGVRGFVVRALEAAGARVHAVPNGREAVNAFRTDPDRWDALVLDLTMPIMGGVEALGAIRDVAPDVPVVLCSGFDASGTLAGLGDPTAVEFLQKPFRAADLIQRLARLTDTDDHAPGLRGPA